MNSMRSGDRRRGGRVGVVFVEALVARPPIKASKLSALTRHRGRHDFFFNQHRRVAGALSVFVATSRFQEVPYANMATIPLDPPTDDTSRLIRAAFAALRQIFREGFKYQKGGVMLSGLEPRAGLTESLFAGYDRYG